jgi:uncharacterized membrane protein (DUF373 family)
MWYYYINLIILYKGYGWSRGVRGAPPAHSPAIPCVIFNIPPAGAGIFICFGGYLVRMDPDHPAVKFLENIISNMAMAIYFGIAIFLAILAIFSFYRVGLKMLDLLGDPSIYGGVLQVLNALLVTIIIVEILETVLAYFRTKSLRVRPILIAGLTAMVRHLLILGVETVEPVQTALTLGGVVVMTAAIVFSDNK